MSEQPATASGVRRALGWVLKVAMSAALLTWLFSQPSTREALAGVDARTGRAVAVAVVVYLGCMALNALKWWLLLAAAGWPVRFGECLRITLIGMFANFFLPTSIGGDVLRVGLITRSGVPASVGALTVFLQRLTGLLAMLGIGLLGMLSSAASAGDTARRLLLASALLTAVLLALLVGARLAELRWNLSARLPAALGRPVRKIAAALGTMGQSPRAMGQVMAVSFVFQLLMVVLQAWLGWAAGARPALVHWFWLVPMMGLGEMVPAGLAGIGTRDATAAYLLGSLGYGGQAVLSTLLWHTMKILSSLPGGVLMILGAKESGPAVDKSAA